MGEILLVAIIVGGIVIWFRQDELNKLTKKMEERRPQESEELVEVASLRKVAQDGN